MKHRDTGITEMMATFDVESFVEELVMLVNQGREQHAMVSIHNRVDSLLSEGAFSMCDQLLQAACATDIPDRLMYAMLSDTYHAARDVLPHRERLWSKAISRASESEDRRTHLARLK